MRRSRPRGFTLVEVVTVVAIITVLCALGFATMRSARPRAAFDGVAIELQALVHGARQQALASGIPVAVLVFPDYPNSNRSKGRIVIYQDGGAYQNPSASLFVATALLNFDNYDPAAPAATAPDATGQNGGQVITTLDLPQNVTVGPVGGLGVANLQFPYNSITTNVSCSFCNASGNHRGAIVFDARGRATFFQAAASPSGQTNGGSLSIYSTDLASGLTFTTSTLVITRTTGSVRSFRNG